jgi:hypothetical protein
MLFLIPNSGNGRSPLVFFRRPGTSTRPLPIAGVVWTLRRCRTHTLSFVEPQEPGAKDGEEQNQAEDGFLAGGSAARRFTGVDLRSFSFCVWFCCRSSWRWNRGFNVKCEVQLC